MADWSSERTRQLRKDHALTRKELGDLTGVTITTVYLWEMGQRKPSKTAEILLSRIEQELQQKKLASGQAGKEVKDHGRGRKADGGKSRSNKRGKGQQSKEEKGET
jgi:DNA-binding XRE family transcriptional regulator